eukprot:CAMPEP_0184489850 /NCGR_PEP_ID=MMETSP0113_2-20130426/16496_1 /TAXON_ID=91329 /ORGANISM="Norrisiella sphaerica, Strain BC52" /LENGTH=71 /DNA_ID=CAMNT_0026873491 /DNA_START=637 /DNA_END=852 /DNA_ORIENTATION=-
MSGTYCASTCFKLRSRTAAFSLHTNVDLGFIPISVLPEPFESVFLLANASSERMKDLPPGAAHISNMENPS